MPIAKMPRYKEYLQLIRDRLPDEKVSHSVFVAEYAASLSMIAGVQHDDIVTAAMLHDLCRTEEPGVLLTRARGYGLSVDGAALEEPMLLHGPVAAEECRTELEIDSEDIYEAIYWHTTGRPGLGRTGQLLFLADFSEPTRRFPEAVEARKVAREGGFEAAVRYAAEAKLAFQQSREVLDPSLPAFVMWLRKEYPA